MRPKKFTIRRRFARGSVALIFRRMENAHEELLFIQRARREGDPWSGDMAFPGGRLQPENESARAAAERETLEETGMDLCRHGRYVTRLSDLITRHHSRLRPMVVTPYEVERAVWVPLDYLAAGENQSRLPWRTPLGTLNMPCCRYQDACIWGLSYSMLQELLTAGINAKSKIPQ